MSELTIWNLGLARTGDDATVTSPSERSRAAELCRQFYPVARDSLLEMHDWNFATTRGFLALTETPSPWARWAYQYAAPANALRVFQVGSQDVIATLDYTDDALRIPLSTAPFFAPQEADQFLREVTPAGEPIIYSNVPDAVARYTILVTDTARFSPLFADTLGWMLASYLAGPLLKGDTGRAESQRLYGLAVGMLGRTAASDANQNRDTDYRETHQAPWMRR